VILIPACILCAQVSIGKIILLPRPACFTFRYGGVELQICEHGGAQQEQAQAAPEEGR